MSAAKKTNKRPLQSILLALCMVISLLASIPMTAQAAGKVDAEYWIEAAELGTFGMAGSKAVGKIKFGLNGSNGRIWAICGKDGDDLVLLSTTGFATGIYGSTSEYSKSNFVEDLKNTDSTYLGTDYFSSGELGKMQPVTVQTSEPDTTNGGNHTVSVDNLKLYLPNSESPQSWDDTTIYVGKDNNIPVDLKTHMIPDQGFQEKLFWLRSPEEAKIDYAHVAYPDIDVNSRYVMIANSHYVMVLPALNLNLSSVLFASSADAAAATGFTASSAMKENTYTLRYESTGSEIAEISADGSQVFVKDANDMYLVAQSNDGVYIKKIEAASEIITAADMSAASGGVLADFNNCEVWIESTADRITTAKAAVTGHDYNTDWASDETNHWHECTRCGDKDTAVHRFGDWTETKAPTCTEDGSRERECTDCGRKETETVAAPGHGYNTDWSSDEAEHWHECTRCGDKKDAAAHRFGDWTETKAPTCTEDGTKERECADCGWKDTETVAAPGHDYNTDWASDEATHWHECTRCGDKKDAADHVWNAESATEDQDKVCTVCKYVAEAQLYTVKVDGDDAYTKGSGKTLKFIASGAKDDCTGIKIDNAVIEAGNYLLESGSTIVTLNNAYLETLGVGDHKITVVYGSREATTSFKVLSVPSQTVPSNPGKTASPKTGDNSNMLLWITLLLTSCGGVITTCGVIRKRVCSK